MASGAVLSDVDTAILARAVALEKGKGPQTRAWAWYDVKAPAGCLWSLLARGLIRLAGRGGRSTTLYCLTEAGHRQATLWEEHNAN